MRMSTQSPHEHASHVFTTDLQLGWDVLLGISQNLNEIARESYRAERKLR